MITKHSNIIVCYGALCVDTGEVTQLWDIAKIKNFINEHVADIWVRL